MTGGEWERADRSKQIKAGGGINKSGTGRRKERVGEKGGKTGSRCRGLIATCSHQYRPKKSPPEPSANW